MGSVSVDDLAEAITRELMEYQQDITDGIKEDVKAAAKDCAKELRRTSPEYTGSYKRGWRGAKAYESETDIRFEVHNKTDYQIAHLLEYGHANRGGGRTPAHPHINKAAEKAAEQLEKKVEVRVKG